MDKNNIIQSSFRDPCGFVFKKNGEIFRQINNCYKQDYDLLMNSGLYDDLTKHNFLIPHNEINKELTLNQNAYKVIKPELIPFISYPYEWSFSQLKDAALLTLQVQEKALKFGMSLKDASSYNIQFKDGKPIFIDTLSFEKYEEGNPWVAYKQFCQHFFAPLVLMKYKDIRLRELQKIYIDGIPLDLASLLLPKKTYFNLSILFHIHFHSKAQKKYSDKKVVDTKGKFSKKAFLGFLDNLKTGIISLNIKKL